MVTSTDQPTDRVNIEHLIEWYWYSAIPVSWSLDTYIEGVEIRRFQNERQFQFIHSCWLAAHPGMSQGKSQTRYSGWKKVPSKQCLRIPTPWVHWQKEASQEPSGNSPSSLQVWLLQLSCSVVVVCSEGELVVSFAREAERATGIRAKRSSFMVDDFGLVLELFLIWSFSWSFLGSGGCSSTFFWFNGSLGNCGSCLCCSNAQCVHWTVGFSCSQKSPVVATGECSCYRGITIAIVKRGIFCYYRGIFEGKSQI